MNHRELPVREVAADERHVLVPPLAAVHGGFLALDVLGVLERAYPRELRPLVVHPRRLDADAHAPAQRDDVLAKYLQPVVHHALVDRVRSQLCNHAVLLFVASP